MNKFCRLLLPLPIAIALLAMVPQDPQGADDPVLKNDLTQVVRCSQLQYVDLAGQTKVLTARSMVEVRMADDGPRGMRLEIYYENGDYSLIEVQGLHLIRQGQDVQDVRLVRTRTARTKFPRIP